jgi:protein SCO1/2
MAILGSDASSVQVAMVTVDPERDSLESLGAYVHNFDPSFIGLREEDTDKLAAIIAEFGVFYEIQDHPEGSGDYLVSHTPSLIVLDHSGMRLVIRGGTSAEDIAADLRALLKLG